MNNRLCFQTAAMALLCLSPTTCFAGWSLGDVDGVPACSYESKKQNAVMTADGAGGVFIVWEDSRNPPAVGSAINIYGQHLSASGEPLWPIQGLPICTASNAQQAPQVASDGYGGVFVAWTDGRDDSFGTDIYAQHLNSDGSVASGWAVGGNAVATSGQSHDVQVIPDGTGGAILLWLQSETNKNNAVYGQKLSASGSPAWGAEGLDLTGYEDTGSATGNYTELRAASDGQGGVVFAWSRFAGNGNSDIHASRVNAAGTVPSAAGTTVCAALRNQLNPRVVGDGSGGAYVSWYDDRAADQNGRDLYAAHMLAVGGVDPAWPANGKALTTNHRVRAITDIVSDGAGGAIAVWVDTRMSNWSLYGSRVRADGSLPAGWSAGGNSLAVSSTYQALESVAVADGVGGCYISWKTGSADPHDIWSQRITSGGTPAPGWEANGRAVFSPSSMNMEGALSPLLAAHRTGLAVVSWIDFRSGYTADRGHSQVYAEQIGVFTGYPLQQTVRTWSAGEGYQTLVYNYNTTDLVVSSYQNASGPYAYSLSAGQWVGIFHYDYAQAAFTESVYKSRNPLVP